MGEPTVKGEVGNYGSVNQAQPKASPEGPKHHHRHYPLYPGILYLAAFVIIYSANNAVLVKLFAQGPPFTACPILCAGNVMGIVTLFPIFHKDLKPSKLIKIPWQTYGWMVLGSIMSNVLGNLFYLRGLALTSVTATAIMRRLEAADFLVVGALCLGDRPNLWVAFNGFLTVVAVVGALLYPHYFEGEKLVITLGYAYLLAGGWAYTLSLLVTKKYLVHVPVGILTCFKVTIGTILFHLLSMWEHGWNFRMLYSLKLWLNMTWYGPLFVTSLNILWLRALLHCSPTVLSLGMNCNFIVTVIWGIIVANDWPNPAESVAGAVILISVLSGAAETIVSGQHRRVKKEGQAEEEEDEEEDEDAVGIEEAGVVVVVEHKDHWEGHEETLPLSGVVRRRKVITVEDDNLLYGSSPKYL